MPRKPRFLDDFTGEYRASGEQRQYRRCPVCGDTRWKTFVDPETGKWICFTGSCKAYGRVRVGDTASSLKERLFTRGRGVHEFSAIDMPETWPLTETWSKMLSARYNLQNPERYLLSTGTGDLAGRVVIPYADRKGDFIFWNARSMLDAAPKYLAMAGAKPLYVPQHVYRKQIQDTILLVEGPFDALSLHDRFGVHAVALGGTSLSESQLPELKRLVNAVSLTHADNLRRVRVLLDSAALSSALALRHKLSGLLPRHDIQVRQLPAGVKDPAAAKDYQLQGCLR